MKHMILQTILCVLVSASSVCADGPKLIKEKLLIAEKGKNDIIKASNSMRLSPDGKHLLYIRRKMVQVPARAGRPPRQQRFYRITLRNLASGKDKTLPIPAYTFDDIAIMLLSMNVFDTAGKRIVLGAGIDADGDGFHDYRKEKMEATIYDIASGKTTTLPVTAQGVFPTFDRTGKKLIIMTFSKKTQTGKLFTTPVDKVNLKQHHLWGLPRSVCPTADVLPLALLPDPKAVQRYKLILFDLKADKQVAELPIHEKNTSMDDYNPQWTGNGRYLYYLDLKDDSVEGRPVRKTVTRIWDRTAGKVTGVIDEAVAIGPGPGKTTMVLTGRSSASFLHDAATGKSWPLCDNSKKVIAAQGKHLIYSKKTPDGKAGVYVCEIVPPTKPRPPKDK